MSGYDEYEISMSVNLCNIPLMANCRALSYFARQEMTQEIAHDADRLQKGIVLYGCKVIQVMTGCIKFFLGPI